MGLHGSARNRAALQCAPVIGAAGTQSAPVWTADEIAGLGGGHDDPAETLEKVARLLRGHLPGETCVLYLLDAERAVLNHAASAGGCIDRRTPSIAVGEGAIGRLAETRVPYADGATIAVPLVDKGLLQAVAVLQAPASSPFRPDSSALMQAAVEQRGAIVRAARAELRRRLELTPLERRKADLLDTLAAGLSHELNNRLMPMASYAELMLDEARRLGSADL